MAIPPATDTTEAVPAAMTEDAITSGAGIGISPKNGRLKVATVSDEVFSRFFGRFVGICSGFIFSPSPLASSSFQESTP